MHGKQYKGNARDALAVPRSSIARANSATAASSKMATGPQPLPDHGCQRVMEQTLRKGPQSPREVIALGGHHGRTVDDSLEEYLSLLSWEHIGLTDDYL